jgi:hypothetical protein
MIPRKPGSGFGASRKFGPSQHAATPAGQKLTYLSNQLAANGPTLQIRADPDALAPERLPGFELAGRGLKFEQAVRLVPGLEFLGAEDLEADEVDENPALYLMVPSEGALRDIASLWRGWQQNDTVPYRFGPWKTLLSQLRDIRPWGAQDRITPGDHEILSAEAAMGFTTVRVEIELVFRANAAAAERRANERIEDLGGVIVSRSRIEGAGYHALLCDIPTLALRNALDREPNSLVGSEAVLQIRPQSILQSISIEETAGVSGGQSPTLQGDSITAIFDAVPLSAHPRLAGALSVDDPFDLEALAVGPRKHGTAMASAVVHGDINAAWTRPLERPVYFVNMLYATADLEHPERFPDRLPADMFESALVRMREGQNPLAPHVIIINASLGDPNKPFYGRMSGWARVSTI